MLRQLSSRESFYRRIFLTKSQLVSPFVAASQNQSGYIQAMADENFSSLFDLLPMGAYRSTPDGRLLRANAALVRLNGYTSEAEMLAAVADIASECYVAPTRRAEFMRLLQTQSFVSDFVSEIYRHKTRERIWVREHAHALRDASGNIEYYEGTVEDLSAERAAQFEIATSERRFRAMTEKVQVITLICDQQGIISYASPASLSILGVAPGQLLRTCMFDLMHPQDRALSGREFQLVLTGSNSGIETISRFRHADGSWRYLAAVGNNALADDAVRGVIINLRDVTAARLAEARLTRLASVDMLTGLNNRRAFEAAGTAALELTRATPGCLAALYFIDLDRFKLINDTEGHATGDAVLREIGQRLGSQAPENAVVGRLGGDEFAMLLPCLDSAFDTEAIAAQLVRTLAVPITVHGMNFTVTASVGVSVFPQHADSFDLLLRHADLAMLDAKATRRDAFRVFDPSLAANAQDRMTMTEELRVALTSDQLEVFYQPQVSLVDAELVGLEALVRWRHPTRGLIAPDAFIALAEDVGLIGAVGQIVAEHAVRDVSRWQKIYGRSLTLALNISAYQLRDSIFVEQLRDTLRRYDFAADDLELEITESALVASLDLAPDVLRALNRLGARVVLDDLGVAYSSFSYLKLFRVRGVKLHRGFVIGVPSDGTDSAIVRAIISLARSLKLRLVAQGIEYAEQRAYLIEQGCEVGQGYLFARPMSASAIEELFAPPRHTVGQPLLLLPNRPSG